LHEEEMAGQVHPRLPARRLGVGDYGNVDQKGRNTLVKKISVKSWMDIILALVVIILMLRIAKGF